MPPAGVAFEVVVDTLSLDSATGSLAPYLAAGQVGIEGVDAGPWLSWIEPVGEGHRLAIARWDGSGWVRRGSIGTESRWFVNWADVPSVEPSGEGKLWAHWLEMLGDGRYAYGVRIARSEDGGVTWSTPEWLHDDRSQAEHGFAALVGDDSGGMTAVWLDGAAYGAGGNEMSVRSRVVAADGSMGPEDVLDARTCDCCPNAAIRLDDARLLAAYRDRSEDEVRDIRMVSYADGGWSEPASVHADGWRIEACPVNGPALDADGERVAIAWFTMVDGGPAVFVAFSGDGGATFHDRIRVDDGKGLGRVDLVMEPDGTAIVVWMEAQGDDREAPAGVMARRVAPSGEMSVSRHLVTTSGTRASGYPRFVRAGEDYLLAWTEVSPDRRVRTARIRWRE